MKFLSVCSGIEAASVAWAPLGWKAWAFSEIDRFACAVLAHHYPSVPNLGDMTKFKDWPDGSIDLLCGGTPCQSFSNAGLREGLDDPRGQLMLTFGAIAARYRPRWLVWENVPGVLSSNGGRDFGAFLGLLGFLGYGFAYRVLDAQFVRVDGYGRAVPQRRQRVFVVGCLGDWRSAAAVFLERESLQGHPAPRRRTQEDVAAHAICGSDGGIDREDRHTLIPAVVGALTAACGPNGHGGSGLATDKGAEAGHLIAYGGNNTSGPIDVSTALLAQPGSGWKGDFESETFVATAFKASHFTRGKDGAPSNVAFPLTADADRGDQDTLIAFDTTQITSASNYSNPKAGDPCHPLAAGAHAPAIAFPQNLSGTQHATTEGLAPAMGAKNPTAVASAMRVRRLMPVECERLQGFPDGYTQVPYRGKAAKDGPRYRALGNSWAVNCPRWIGQRIAMVDSIRQGAAA
jgi:DNA (cytosine-5)-methyltransferase 1